MLIGVARRRIVAWRGQEGGLAIGSGQAEADWAIGVARRRIGDWRGQEED